jgi:ParB family chromosome partitioning protein
MADKPRSKPAKTPAKPRARKKKTAEPGSRGLSPAEMARSETAPPAVAELEAAIAAAGGQALARYREPLEGGWLVLGALPLERVDPTPFQRDLSEAHAKRLADVIARVGRFLDPVIVVPEDGRFFSPNGRHRLAALAQLGARSVTVLAAPDPALAYRILALNTEKAHNLRERALEVIRMARELAKIQPTVREHELALEFEEPALLTIGMCYEARGRFSGGAYHPIVRRVDAFLEQPLVDALAARQERVATLLKLDDAVASAVEALRERGLSSPYLRNFVLARINPLRFRRGATMPWDELFEKMTSAAARFDASKIRPQDLAGAQGPAEEAGA